MTHLIPRPVLALPVLLLLYACGQGDAPAKADEAKKPRNTSLPVRVVVVGPGTVVETLGVQGRLEVWRREILTTRVAGVVQEVPVLPNQLVKTGDVVLRLLAPTSDLEAAARANVKLDRAKRDLERREKLMRIAPETMSASDLDVARDLVTDSALEVKIYQQREDSRRVVAPYDGVLVMPSSTAAANSQQVTVGQQVTEGFQIADLLDVSRFRLALDLPETRLCLTLAKERLVPFETARHIAHADDRPCAFHNIYDNKLIHEKKKRPVATT